MLLDVDGPLTRGFLEKSCRVIRELGVEAWPDACRDYEVARAFGLNPSQEATMYRELRRQGTAYAFRPRDGAAEFIAGLQGWADVWAVTSPLVGSPTWAAEREDWLSDFLGIPRSRVVSAHAKHVVSGHVFVDDKPGHLVAWATEHPSGLAVLWEDVYNVDDPWAGPRARDFTELSKTLEALK